MHGAGTRTAITTARSFPALLDITRLTSRVGRGPHTGVDRVELAYLEWCLATEPDVWGLAKIASGFVFLDRDGLRSFYDRLMGKTLWGARDLRAVVGIKTPAPRGAAESDLRRLAARRTDHTERGTAFASFGEAGFVYLNVGHSNFSHGHFSQVREAKMRVAVFLHDLIPLEFQHFQRAGSVEAFEQKMQAAAQSTDLILTNSQDSATKIVSEITRRGCHTPVSFAHLGVDTPLSEKAASTPIRPYFVSLGTIEPRKNHAFLLDIWEELDGELASGDIPDLYIIGQRGWVHEDVITRLDHLKAHPRIHEENAMGDAALWPLVMGAHGLLFPSYAEGFGLPSLEAAALGVPVICGDLAIHRELLGDYPVYADLQDRYLWKKTIIEQAGKRLDDLRKDVAHKVPHIPTWDEHFDRINAAVMGSV
ncbi:MAG: glycosyltransferase [Pseudomonadota bacterium]